MSVGVVSDVSDIFWEFVHSVSCLPYEELVLTKGFSRIVDGIESLHHHFALDARVLHLDTNQCHHICAHLPEHEGVSYDSSKSRFLFKDVTSLFIGGCKLVEASSGDTALLGKCIRHMSAFIDLSDVTSCLAASLNIS